MTDSPNTILLIADISGYTQFMKQHAISITHAKQIIVRLLKALMQTAKPPLRVAELEGDAVFFYARTKTNDVQNTVQQVKGQIIEFFMTFRKEIAEVNSVTTCPCDACQHIHDLQLKQVIHAGHVEIEQIERFEKLFGLDVILVHRMLKNSVPVREYVMMTRKMYEWCGDFYGLEPQPFNEEFEGVGEIETVVFYPKELASLALASSSSEQLQAPLSEKLKWRSEQTLKTAAEWLGLLRFRGKFKSVPA